MQPAIYSPFTVRSVGYYGRDGRTMLVTCGQKVKVRSFDRPVRDARCEKNKNTHKIKQSPESGPDLISFEIFTKRRLSVHAINWHHRLLPCFNISHLINHTIYHNNNEQIFFSFSSIRNRNRMNKFSTPFEAIVSHHHHHRRHRYHRMPGILLFPVLLADGPAFDCYYCSTSWWCSRWWAEN